MGISAVAYATCKDGDGYKCYPKDDYSIAPQGDCLEMACEHGCVENSEGDGRCCEHPKDGEDCRADVYKDGIINRKVARTNIATIGTAINIIFFLIFFFKGVC